MLKIAVIGDPIEHSMSPVVHGAALDALGVSYEYEKVRVTKGGLPEYIRHALDTGTDGFNLTMPHKVDILPYLADIDSEAEAFSSVNTVRIRDGKLYGFNTDAIGYELSLKQCGYEFAGRRVVILGAGGVVRTIALKAAMCGARRVCILNRTREKAEWICGEVRGKTGADMISEGFSADEIARQCASADILINATPLGMNGCKSRFETFDFMNSLPSGALVSDLIYNPYKTEFLAEGERRGHNIQNGLPMLIFQALAADEQYLDRKINMSDVYPAVLAAAQKRLNV